MTVSQKKVLVFGTFDGLHAGHIFFLEQAKKLGEVHALVASKESVEARKHRPSIYTLDQRLNMVKETGLVDYIIAGDKTLHGWAKMKKIKPDIVLVGYDQKELTKALEKEKNDFDFNFQIKVGKALNPKKLHSSILNTKENLCVFCTSKDIQKRKIAENSLAWVFPTNIPIVPGHLLVCPKRCVETFEGLSKKEKDALFTLLKNTKTVLKKTFDAEGFNIAWNEGSLFGQSVPHLHIHVLPRKTGDTGIIKYDPRKFLYRPGSREETPEKELLKISSLIRKNFK